MADHDGGRRSAAHYSAVRSCLACALAKQRCNGERPCERCATSEECCDPPANYKRLLREGGASAVRAAAARAVARAASREQRRGAASGTVDPAARKRRRDGSTESTTRETRQRARMREDAAPAAPLPRFIPPRVHVFERASDASAAVLRSLPLGLRTLLSAAQPAVRDALMPRMSINSFVAFWRTQWQRLGSAAMLTSSPSFFRELDRFAPLGLDGIGALEAQLSDVAQDGVAPIPDDALAVLLPPPDTSGMSDVMAAALLEAHDMIVDEYASAAVQACSAPVTRATWFRHSFTPRAVVSNVPMAEQFCTSVTGMAKAYASGVQLVWMDPEAVVNMVMSGVKARNGFLRQHVVCEPVLQQVYDADDAFLGYRRCKASHVIVNTFHPDGRVRSSTVYMVDLSPASQEMLSPDAAWASNAIVSAVLKAPASMPELHALQMASQTTTGQAALLWQPRRSAALESVAVAIKRAIAVSRVPAALRAPLKVMASTTFAVCDDDFAVAFVDSILSAQMSEWHRVLSLYGALQGKPTIPAELPSQDAATALAQCVDISVVAGGPRVNMSTGDSAVRLWTSAWLDPSVLQSEQPFSELCVTAAHFLTPKSSSPSLELERSLFAWTGGARALMGDPSMPHALVPPMPIAAPSALSESPLTSFAPPVQRAAPLPLHSESDSDGDDVHFLSFHKQQSAASTGVEADFSSGTSIITHAIECSVNHDTCHSQPCWGLRRSSTGNDDSGRLTPLLVQAAATCGVEGTEELDSERDTALVRRRGEF